MKDRFQYRAKDVKTDEWRYGYYAELPCGLGSSGVNGEYADTDAFILNYTKKQSALYSNAEPHEVVVGEQYKIDEKTLSQCTGLKDKNGKMIYENDIVVEKLMGFKDCVKIVDWIEDTMTGFNLNNEGEYEVIGNIYENPESLEEHNEE